MERFIKAFFLVPSKEEEALVQPATSAMEEEKKEGEVVPTEVKPEVLTPSLLLRALSCQH
jgi:hypothetical protein